MPKQSTMTRRETRMGKQTRDSSVKPSTYNAETHTVEIVAATGFEVLRWGWDGPYYERLKITDDAVDLSRVEKGICPLLDTHSRWSLKDQLGKHTAARIENGELILTAQFAQTDFGREIEQRVADGEVSATSVGYRTLEMMFVEQRDNIPIYEVTRWVLLENSLVPVPADPDSGVRSAEEEFFPCVIHEKRTSSMPKPVTNAPEQDDAERSEAGAGNPPASAAPVAVVAPNALSNEARAERMTVSQALDFVDQARTFGVDVAQARTWAEQMTPEAARSELLRSAAERQNATAPNMQHGQASRVTVDARDTQRSAITEALLHRYNPGVNALTDLGREYRGLSLIEMGREVLSYNGEKVKGLSKREIADKMLSRQHSTSDFPLILGNVAGKTLRAAYESSSRTFTIWMRRVTMTDFKPVSRLQLGGAPSFLLVPEGGEFKMGSIGEAREMYSLATYGRRFSLTRQTLINDDLDAFTRIPEMFGRAAADFESDAAYAPIIANPNMGDNIALFHASHGNLAATAAVPNADSLQEAYLGMSRQTGIEGRLINVQPKYLLTGIKDQVSAEKILTAITATATGDVNVMSRRGLEPVFEPRLNMAPGIATPWFMAASNQQIDTAEYAYLEGEEGVYLEQKEGYEIDGIDFKARLDFASKVIDWRGLWKNPGVQ